MTQNTAADPDLIPDSAPFTAEQRTWLNGFFAGLLSLDGGVNPLSAEEAAALLEARRRLRRPATTAMARRRGTICRCRSAERMALANGRPLRRRMMAAMGQQDCGQCGYTCEDYGHDLLRKKSGSTFACRAARKPPAC